MATKKPSKTAVPSQFAKDAMLALLDAGLIDLSQFEFGAAAIIEGETILDTHLAAMMPKLAEALMEKHGMFGQLFCDDWIYRLNVWGRDRVALKASLTAALERAREEVGE